MASPRNLRSILPLVLVGLIAFAIAPAARALGPHGDIFAGHSNADGVSGWEGALHLKVVPSLA